MIVEGRILFKNFDALQLTGSAPSFAQMSFVQYVTDGVFSLQLDQKSTKLPQLAALSLQGVAVQHNLVPLAQDSAPTHMRIAATATPGAMDSGAAVTWSTTTVTQRIHLGGSTQAILTDADGHEWGPDTQTLLFDSHGAMGTAVDVCATHPFHDWGGLPSELHCQFREWYGSTSAVFQFPLLPKDEVYQDAFVSRYSVEFYWSETSAATGERVMDVLVDGVTVLEGLDIADRIDGSYGSFSFAYSTNTVAHGSYLEVQLRTDTGSPKLAAMAVTSTLHLPPTKAPTVAPTPAYPCPVVPDTNGYVASVQDSCPGSILDVARSMPELSRATSHLEVAGLTSLFANCEGPFTAFFPVNDAFAGLPEDFDLFVTEDHLRSSVLYHTLPGAFYQDDFVPGSQTKPTALRPLSGNNTVLYIEEDDPSSLFFNYDNWIVTKDLETCNGVIHVISGLFNAQLSS